MYESKLKYTTEYTRCIYLEIQSVHTILYIYMNSMADEYPYIFFHAISKIYLNQRILIMTCMYLYSDRSAAGYVHSHEPSHRDLMV